MRRLLAPALIVGLAATALVGCSSAPVAGGDCAAPAAPDSAVFETIEVSGAVGGEAALEAYTPISVPETTWEQLAAGEGTALTADQQVLTVSLSFFRGSDGSQLSVDGSDGALTTSLPFSGLVSTVPALSESLECARPGARVVTVASPDAISEQFSAGLGLEADENLVVVADVDQVMLAKADGADQFVDGRGLPSVVRAPDGTPGVTVPGGDAPTELQVVVLKKGTGEAVTADTRPVVAYTGLTWAEPAVFKTTWGESPIVPSAEAVGEGFLQAIDGQTVGSQLLVVVPPELGFGEAGTTGVPADATLVYVIDILGTLAP